MKFVKRITALFLALTMVMAMGITAFAEDPSATVTVEYGNNHTYSAYQIFTGTQAAEDKLTNVKWGTGINVDNFITALKGDSTIGSHYTAAANTDAGAAAVAEALSKNTSDAAQFAKLALANKTTKTATLTAGDTKLATGYYLVVDETESMAQGDAYNAALLDCTQNIKITKKTDAPTVLKKVNENEKSAATSSTYGEKYNDVADYNIGDAVPFHLIGLVPDMSKYDTYKYIFHDTLDIGLTAPLANYIKVYLSSDQKVDFDSDGTTLVGGDTDVTSSFTKTVNGQNITVSIDNLKSVAGIAQGNYIIVAYTAELNTSAKIGLPGNVNEVYLEYSNKPDQSGEGDSNKTGRTPEDKVIVFTYELDNTKVDKANHDTKLPDAEFVLYRGEGQNIEYVKVDASGYVTGWTSDKNQASTLKSNAQGLFKVIGLDDNTYHILETKEPSGYNKLTDPIDEEIIATTVNGDSWNDFTPANALTKLQIKVNNGEAKDGTLEGGVVKADIENAQGSTLPSTGGMGTTLFYVAGVALIIAAGVVVIVRKKNA